MIRYPYNPTRHIVPQRFEATEALCRKFQRKDLFVYLNRRSGNWVVSLMHPDRKIEDLVIVGKCEDAPVSNYINPRIVAKLDYLLNGPPVDIRKAVASGTRDAVRGDQECDEELSDAMKFLSRR